MRLLITTKRCWTCFSNWSHIWPPKDYIFYTHWSLMQSCRLEITKESITLKFYSKNQHESVSCTSQQFVINLGSRRNPNRVYTFNTFFHQSFVGLRTTQQCIWIKHLHLINSIHYIHTSTYTTNILSNIRNLN